MPPYLYKIYMLYSDKIVWLSSYPKSGNTWVRAFLSDYLFSKNKDFEFSLLHNIEKFPKKRLFPDCIVEPENSGLRSILSGYENFLDEQKDLKGINKTHNAYNEFFTNKNLTAGFVYITRNVKDIIISFAYHYNCSIDDAIDLAIPNRKKHIESWKRFTDVPSLYLNYEDIVKDTKKEYTKLLHFLHIKMDKKKLDKSIKNTSFSNLKKLEIDNGFFESADYKTEKERPFFRIGKVKQWENVFNNNQKERINSLLY